MVGFYDKVVISFFLTAKNYIFGNNTLVIVVKINLKKKMKLVFRKSFENPTI